MTTLDDGNSRNLDSVVEAYRLDRYDNNFFLYANDAGRL